MILEVSSTEKAASNGFPPTLGSPVAAGDPSGPKHHALKKTGHAKVIRMPVALAMALSKTTGLRLDLCSAMKSPYCRRVPERSEESQTRLHDAKPSLRESSPKGMRVRDRPRNSLADVLPALAASAATSIAISTATPASATKTAATAAV